MLLHLISHCSLRSLNPQRPVIEYLLVVQFFDSLGCIIHILIQDICKPFWVVGLRIFDDLDIQNRSVFDKYPSQVVFTNSSWDTGDIDVITYSIKSCTNIMLTWVFNVGELLRSIIVLEVVLMSSLISIVKIVMVISVPTRTPPLISSTSRRVDHNL